MGAVWTDDCMGFSSGTPSVQSENEISTRGELLLLFNETKMGFSIGSLDKGLMITTSIEYHSRSATVVKKILQLFLDRRAIISPDRDVLVQVSSQYPRQMQCANAIAVQPSCPNSQVGSSSLVHVILVTGVTASRQAVRQCTKAVQCAAR